jgi:uridine phosphorylase
VRVLALVSPSRPTTGTSSLGLPRAEQVELLAPVAAGSGSSARRVTTQPGSSPLLTGKDFGAVSEFEPANLLREGRRQRGLPTVQVPAVCLLDPDGDIVRYLKVSRRGLRHPGWACYHTEMWTLDVDGLVMGVVGMAVGAPFAVLVAEQLAASGATLVLSITSAGRISPQLSVPCFVLIEQALRDEGTSHHYQPPGSWSYLHPRLQQALTGAFTDLADLVLTGASWTTDAPYRETAAAISHAQQQGAVCVEMEAAGLYAYAAARSAAVVCFAHVTNTMATDGDDFEKGVDAGVHDALAVAAAAARALTRISSWSEPAIGSR